LIDTALQSQRQFPGNRHNRLLATAAMQYDPLVFYQKFLSFSLDPYVFMIHIDMYENNH
jgi:hypothetical protein